MKTRRLLAIIFLAFACAVALHFIPREVRMSRPIVATVTAPRAKVPAMVRSLRPNYPYSVIPGGAYSPAELRYANEKDGVVHAHYADFNLADARLVTLTEDRYQYVSYRLQNQVFWTHKKLRIPKGEVLLTDGSNYARTRCGNRLSSTAKQATAAKQPPTRLLSLPEFRPELLSKGDVQLAPAPPLGELAQDFPLLPFELPILAPYLPPLAQNVTPTPIAAPMIPIGGGGGGYVPSTGNTPTTPGSPPIVIAAPPAPIAEVPEPSSLYLFGAAVAVSLWFITRMIGRSHQIAAAREATADEKPPQS